MQKRRHKRYEVQDVQGSLLFSMDVTVLNMSLDGMAIESMRRLDVNRKYNFKVRHKEELINLEGTVVWCNLSRTLSTESGETIPVYKAGIEFDGVISEMANQLLHFIDENKVLKLEKRVFGRFKLSPKEKVNLNYRYEFIVTTISLSGMSIETELVPEPSSVFDMEIMFGGKNIAIKGRVAYVKKRDLPDERNLALLGVEFIDMSESDRGILEKFITDEFK